MTDIVARLRAYWPDGPGHQIAWEAADEIERLTADLNILKRHYNLAPNAPLSREEIIAAKDAEIERLRATINEQAAAIVAADRLVLKCEQHLADAKQEIARMRADLTEAGVLR